VLTDFSFTCAVGESPFSSNSAVSPEQQHFVLERLKAWEGSDLCDALEYMDKLSLESGINLQYIHWVFSQTRGAALLKQHAVQTGGLSAGQRPGTGSLHYSFLPHYTLLTS